MKNGIIGTHLATGMPVELTLNYKEMQLAMDKNAETINKSWDLLNDAVLERTGNEIIGELDIYYIVVDGVKKVFH